MRVLRYWRCWLTLLFGVGVFVWWFCVVPQAMSYQEQNQLFMFTTDYLLNDLRLSGGLSVWLGEFLVQFYYVEWLGALILALIYIVLQVQVWLYIRSFTCFKSLLHKVSCARQNECSLRRLSAALACILFYLLSFIPSILLFFFMGDYNLLLSFPVALLLAMGLVLKMRHRSVLWDILLLPIAYWLVGSVMWVYVLLRMIDVGSKLWRRVWLAPYLLGLQLIVAYTVMAQWSVKAVVVGVGYYRIPMPYHELLFGYNRDLYEVLRQDYLVRNERWDEIIHRAEKYQPKAAFSSVCVNLALAQKRQLADRMFDFYQSGRDALIMGIFRDNTSDLPSMEAFWHLGMINSCLRYAFDMQEAILNAKRSCRLTKRLAECYVVNGRYDVARKHTALLKHTLFYRSWAKKMEALMQSEEAINNHPLYGRQRALRFKNDFLYNYNEIDKVFGRLFVNNPTNTMALDYFMAQMLLRGSVHAFMQHMSWVQQYGRYEQMPRGYQDAVRCIQAGGELEGSSYSRYIDYMRRAGLLKELKISEAN